MCLWCYIVTTSWIPVKNAPGDCSSKSFEPICIKTFFAVHSNIETHFFAPFIVFSSKTRFFIGLSGNMRPGVISLNIEVPIIRMSSDSFLFLLSYASIDSDKVCGSLCNVVPSSTTTTSGVCGLLLMLDISSCLLSLWQSPVSRESPGFDDVPLSLSLVPLLLRLYVTGVNNALPSLLSSSSSLTLICRFNSLISSCYLSLFSTNWTFRSCRYFISLLPDSDLSVT